MLDAMAVRTKDDAVFYCMQSALCLFLPVVCVASRLIPPTSLAFIPVVADHRPRPRMPRLVAALSTVDRVAFTVIPDAATLNAPALRLRPKTTARLGAALAETV